MLRFSVLVLVLVLGESMATVTAAADLELHIVVTREIHGAIYPLDEAGSKCDPSNANTCETCLGGAARRHRALDDAKAEASVRKRVPPESFCATSVTTSHVHARTLHCTTPPLPSPPRVAPSPLRTSGSLLHPCADADVRIMFDDVITVLQAAAANNGEGVDIVTIDTGAFFFGASPFFHAFSGDVRYECFKHPVYSKG